MLARRVCALVLAATTGLSVAALGPAPGAGAKVEEYPQVMALPNGWMPEGIAIGPGKTAWLGSRVDGDIYRLNLKTGVGAVVSQGPGTPSVGLKSDDLGRLFVAGGNAGNARVVDTATGAIVQSYQLTLGSSFVNDVFLRRKSVWLTDSVNAQLYKIPLGVAGALPAPAEVETISLSGEWTQVAGFNANGITRTPDHKALLVVNSTTGILYRIDPATGAATAVDLGGTLLTNGDGLLIKDDKLFVVQNQLNQIAVLKLAPDGTSGVLKRTITSPTDSAGTPLFDVPTTVARFGSRLYLPNGRFTTVPTPSTTYTVVQVPLKKG